MWTSIISNTNRSSQCNCSPIAVLHTEDVVRLPKTCFSLVETGSSLVISKPLIFYKYWMQEWDMFLSQIQWESLWDWKRAVMYLRTSTFSEFTALVLVLVFLHEHIHKVVWSCSSTGAAVPGMGINVIIRCMYPPWTLPTLSEPIPLRRLVVASEEWGKMNLIHNGPQREPTLNVSGSAASADTYCHP